MPRRCVGGRAGLVAALCGLAALASAAPARDDAPGEALDAVLMSALQAAAQRHPSVAASSRQEEAARLDLAALERKQYPRPSVAWTARAGATSADVRLTQTLHDWGATSARIDSAESQVGAASARRQEARRAIVLALLEQWRQWATAQLRLASTESAMGRLTVYGQSARARGRSGFGSDADVALVQARVAQTAAEALSYQAAAAAALAQLHSLGLAEPPPVPGWPAMVKAVSSRAWPMASLTALAEQASPTLARFRREAQAADALSRALSADRWPVINAVASHQRADGASGSGASSRLFVTIEYAPGSWGGDAQAARAAVARAEAARADLEAARLDSTGSLQAQWNLVTGLQQRLPLEVAGAESNLSVLRSFERQFEAGRKSWLDVLNAARDLSASEASAATVALELAVAQVRLAVLAGMPTLTEVLP